MNLQNKSLQAILLITGFIHATNVFAYLDPGTGSLLVQMFLGAVAGVLVTMNLWWHKIKSFFTSIFSKSGKEVDGASDNNLE